MTWGNILDGLKPIELPPREPTDASGPSIDESLREITRVAEKIGRIHFRTSQSVELTGDRIQTIGQFLQEHVESVEQSLREERRKIGELESTLELAIATLMELTDLGASAAAAAQRELGQDAASQFHKLYSEMLRACTRIGLEPVAVTGDPFDSINMESVEEVDVPGKDRGEITEVIRQGFRFAGKTRRTAKVVIAR